MTQERLAEAAEVSWRYLQQIEAGDESNPSLKIICALKEALACGWEQLLDGLP